MKSHVCPKALPVKRFFFALPNKFRIPQITDTVKPQQKCCFRQDDFGGVGTSGGGGGCGEWWEGGEVGEESNCAGVRVGEILRQVECRKCSH